MTGTSWSVISHEKQRMPWAQPDLSVLHSSLKSMFWLKPVHKIRMTQIYNFIFPLLSEYIPTFPQKTQNRQLIRASFRGLPCWSASTRFESSSILLTSKILGGGTSKSQSSLHQIEYEWGCGIYPDHGRHLNAVLLPSHTPPTFKFTGIHPSAHTNQR